jgi:hypothetical protein
MQKILLAIDARELDMNSLEFACYLGQLTNSKVTGVFLENLVADQKLVLRPAYGSRYPDWEIKESSPKFQEKMKKIKANIALFRETCEKKAVRHDMHRDQGVPKLEIIYETRFADLLVMPAGMSFKKWDEGVPTHFIKTVLKDSECPVIVAPEKFQGIDEIVFAYDGSRSSAFAIRQFTYLFPLLSDKKVTVLQANKKGEWPADEKNNIQDWLSHHYSSVGFETLKGDADEKLSMYLFRKKNVFIVMGAFGRNALSMFFKQSSAELLMQLITQPVFIAHH